MTKPSLYLDVPSCWSDYLDTGIYDEAVETAPPGSILVEVGSFWGKGAIYLAELARSAAKDLRVYCVDVWSMTPENDPTLFRGEGIEPRIHTEHHNNLFETFAYYVERSKLSPDPLRIMRMESLEAASFFQSCPCLHFVFLDDRHDYPYVLAELKAWEPLVSAGGIIAGHDYCEEFDGVIKATEKYFGSPPEVLGRCTWVVR